jgi:KaiC/GvpD/RAD55 family RecA-like ATPase
VSTGAPRLDDLLEGGLPEGSATLFAGAPVLGKELVARLFILHGLRHGRPAIVVLGSRTAGEARAELTQLDPRFPDYERVGLVRFIDLYTRYAGVATEARSTELLEGPGDLDGLLTTLARHLGAMAGKRGGPSLVVDSVSTLAAFQEPARVFRALHQAAGKARACHATALLLLERGMHAEHEVAMFKHLASGTIEVRNQNAKNLVRVEGHLVTEDRGWVEYRFTPREFEITGSFSGGRIR